MIMRILHMMLGRNTARDIESIAHAVYLLDEPPYVFCGIYAILLWLRSFRRTDIQGVGEPQSSLLV